MQYNTHFCKVNTFLENFPDIRNRRRARRRHADSAMQCRVKARIGYVRMWRDMQRLALHASNVEPGDSQRRLQQFDLDEREFGRVVIDHVVLDPCRSKIRL